MDGLRPTLDPFLDSNAVRCLLTLAQMRENCSSKRRGKWLFRPASALCSVGRKKIVRASVVAKANVFSCHQR